MRHTQHTVCPPVNQQILQLLSYYNRPEGCGRAGLFTDSDPWETVISKSTDVLTSKDCMSVKSVLRSFTDLK